MRSRTVYAVAFTEDAAGELVTWARMFDHSDPWLHWALSSQGFAIPQELASSN